MPISNEYDAHGHAPLHSLSLCAISSETRLGLAQRLLDGDGRGGNRADINLATLGSAYTPLHISLLEKDVDLFVFLLQRGADPALRNRHGANALYALATDMHTSGPYHMERLEKTLKFLLDVLSPASASGASSSSSSSSPSSLSSPPSSSSAAGPISPSPGVAPVDRLASALWDIVEPPGFPRAEHLGDITGTGSADSFALPPAQPPPSSLDQPPPPPPVLRLYARPHMYELLDERLQSLLTAADNSPPVSWRHDAPRPDILRGVQPHAFRSAIKRAIGPRVRRELDGFLIPDLARMVTDYLL